MMKNYLLLLLCGIFACVTLRAQDQPSAQKSTSMITIGGVRYYVHTVHAGDTFYSLEKLYDTSEETLKASNPHIAEGLKADQVIKIPVASEPQKPMSDKKLRRIFDLHTVNQGETAYSIAQRYGIGIDVLMEDNPGFDPAHLAIGQQIRIRKQSQGQRDDAEIDQQMESYTQALNQVSDRFTHHVVEKGETLYSLSKHYALPVDSITQYNADQLRDGLKVGNILKIPRPQPVATPAVDSTVIPAQKLFPAQRFQTVDRTATLRVAMLLPLKVNGSTGRQFVEFYQGALLALEELKKEGISVQLDLFNTARSVEEMTKIMQDEALQQAQLLIGPVYEECYPPVAAWAAEHGVPVVSPLGVLREVDIPQLFQVAPAPEHKFDKLRADFSEDANVILISGSHNDTEFASEIASLLPNTTHKLNYTKGMSTATVEEMLSGEHRNVIIVLPSDELTVEGALAYVSSAQNSLISRSIKNPEIEVIGSSQWARFRNIEKNLFFKLNLRYVTSYHADRGNERIAQFDRRYLREFNGLPSLYAYRGYDVTKLFIQNLHRHGADLPAALGTETMVLLQTPYHFIPSTTHKQTNVEWVLVNYKNDYTIEVK